MPRRRWDSYELKKLITVTNKRHEGEIDYDKFLDQDYGSAKIGCAIVTTIVFAVFLFYIRGCETGAFNAAPPSNAEVSATEPPTIAVTSSPTDLLHGFPVITIDNAPQVKLVAVVTNMSHTNAVAWSSDGKTLAVAGATDIALYQAANLNAPPRTFTTFREIRGIAYSFSDNILVSGGDDGLVQLWSVQTGYITAALSGHAKFINSVSVGVNSVAFSRDELTIASAGGDRTVRLWDIASQQQRQLLTGHGDVVTTVAFSPDGQTLASGSADKAVRLWAVKSGELLQTLAGHTGSVNSVAFSPDGQTLASGSEDRTVRLWKVHSGQLLQTLSGHTGAVNSVVFSPNGQLLVSGAADNTVRLWQIGQEPTQTLQTLTADAPITSLAFNPDGTLLASGSTYRTVRAWAVLTIGAS